LARLSKFIHVFEGREAFESLRPPAIITCVDEVVEVRGQWRVAVVMVALDRCFPDRPVHPFDLPVSPGMSDLGEPLIDPVFVAPHVEHVGHISGWGAVSGAWREGKLDTVIGQLRVYFIGHSFDQGDQESAGHDPVCVSHELDERKLAGAVDTHVRCRLPSTVRTWAKSIWK